MKKNGILAGVLFVLLLITWLVAEKGIFSSQFPPDRALKEELQRVQSYELPMAKFKNQKGKWVDSEGELVKAELLNELHRALESISVARKIDNPDKREIYFTSNLAVKLNDVSFELGDITPGGDGFYWGLKGDPNIYVVDLNQMGSLAVGDDEQVLAMAKYQRLRDLIIYPEGGWRETRVVPLLGIASYMSFKKGHVHITPGELQDKNWGPVVLNAFMNGLQSLNTKGKVLREKPPTLAIITWEFILPDGGVSVWEFYRHATLPLWHIWFPGAQKGYTLDEDSGLMVDRFPERLLDRPYQITFAQTPGSIKFPEESEKAQAITQFLTHVQTFENLNIVSDSDCQTLAKASSFTLEIDKIPYHWRRMSGGWSIMECKSGAVFNWALPEESEMNFKTLKDKGAR